MNIPMRLSLGVLLYAIFVFTVAFCSEEKEIRLTAELDSYLKLIEDLQVELPDLDFTNTEFDPDLLDYKLHLGLLESIRKIKFLPYKLSSTHIDVQPIYKSVRDFFALFSREKRLVRLLNPIQFYKKISADAKILSTRIKSSSRKNFIPVSFLRFLESIVGPLANVHLTPEPFPLKVLASMDSVKYQAPITLSEGRQPFEIIKFDDEVEPTVLSTPKTQAEQDADFSVESILNSIKKETQQSFEILISLGGDLESEQARDLRFAFKEAFLQETASVDPIAWYLYNMRRRYLALLDCLREAQQAVSLNESPKPIPPELSAMPKWLEEAEQYMQHKYEENRAIYLSYFELSRSAVESMRLKVAITQAEAKLAELTAKFSELSQTFAENSAKIAKEKADKLNKPQYLPPYHCISKNIIFMEA
jgi:hypothetical protein